MKARPMLAQLQYRKWYKPWGMGCSFIHGFFAGFTMICFSWQLVVLVGVTKNQFVVSETEGIPVDGARVEICVRVSALSLTS